MGTNAIKFLNKIFKKPLHPFNMQNDKSKTYAMWQYEKGIDTINFYLDNYTKEEMFLNKNVLDFGCGAGGKSLYYASLGATMVTGVDVVPRYEDESRKLAESLGLSDKFNFVLGDATKMPFQDNTFDTVIMNDFMEHVDEPKAALLEAIRLIKKGGRIYINFPPYNHPFGAHLSDAINMPWVHVFFSEKTLIKAYKELVKDLPDGKDRISFRISTDDNGKEYFSYINKMTIKRFNLILRELGIKPAYYKESALRKIVSPFAKLPILKEFFVKMVVCVVEKGE